MEGPIYSHVKVDLMKEGTDPLKIISVVAKALKKDQGVGADRRFTEDALAASSYEKVLELAKETVVII